jgi:thiamine kinase-like enzyme
MDLNEVLIEIESQVGAQVRINRILSAQTNAVYRIRSSRGDWSLRINNLHAATLGISRSSELNVLNVIKQFAWSPKTVATKPDYQLTNWEPGTFFNPEDQESLDRLITLYMQLSTVDSTQLEGVEYLNILSRISKLRVTVPEDPKITRLANGIMNLYSMPKDTQLCYHDWHRENLLITEKGLCLLDWEYAALGDPLIDLACLISGLELTNRQIKYVSDRLSVNSDKLQIALSLTELMSLSWYEARFPAKEWTTLKDQWLNRWTNVFSSAI